MSAGQPAGAVEANSADPDAVLPIDEGERGAAVGDVQSRLAALGFSVGGDSEGVFGAGTRAAVEAFQHRRGLRVDGVCGSQTWNTLVEAGFALGGRLLYRRTPMLRGDDVAELQQRLNALGFDAGRVDGIFGDLTAGALGEFQRNTGLHDDAMLGTGTWRELVRMEARYQETELVSEVRARELLRQAPPTLAGRRIFVGEAGGLAPIVAALRRRLVNAGARVTALQHPDDSTQAQQANAAHADAYVGLRLSATEEGCATSFYSGYRYESLGGRRLAELVQARVPSCLGVPDRGVHGMSVTVLRETRMPSVIVEIGPASALVEHGAALADALAESLSCWADTTWD